MISSEQRERLRRRLKRPVIEICADCPDLPARNAAALRKQPRAILTHGPCPDCLTRFKREAAMFAGKHREGSGDV